MKQFLANYGFFILMMAICLGSHFFMHRGHGQGQGGKDGHGHS